MTDSAAAAEKPRAQGVRGLLLGRRRTIVVDWRYQRRVAGIATALVGAGFLAFAASLHAEIAGVRAAVAADPIASRAVEEGLALPTIALISVGLALCASVFLLVLMETHRTAGAALSLKRTLLAMAEGRYGARAVLRRGDQLRDLKAGIDELGQTLTRRVELDAQALDALAERLDVAKAADTEALAAEVRALAQRSRERLEG